MLELGRGRLAALREAEQHDDALGVGSDLVETLANRVEEVAPQDEVLRRIAGDAELREHDDLRAGLPRPVDRFRGQADVAVDVPDRGVDLGERETQIGGLRHKPSMASSAVEARLPRVFRQASKPLRRRGVELMEATSRSSAASTGSSWSEPRRAAGRSAGGAASSRSRSRRSAARSPTSSPCTRSGIWSAAAAQLLGSSPWRMRGSGPSTTAWWSPPRQRSARSRSACVDTSTGRAAGSTGASRRGFHRASIPSGRCSSSPRSGFAAAVRCARRSRRPP